MINGLFCFFQVFVETLDKCFENVCELDLIFHMDKVCKQKHVLCAQFEIFKQMCKWCSLKLSQIETIQCFIQVHFILQEIVMGGMVLETNMSEILTHIEAQNKLEKSEVRCFFKVMNE